MWSHRPSFTIALTVASRVIQLRDRFMGRIPSQRAESPHLSLAQLSIPSGNNLLDAVLVRPTAQPVRATVLLCHGIGEVVAQWFPIQRLLAENGVASLVFDYSGYGQSTGSIHWTQCEQDAITAFHHLEGMEPPGPISILGFSLGSGVAAAVVNELNANRLVLCAAYTSFAEATHAVGIPRFLSRLVPPIWSAEESLRTSTLPILVIHSTGDRLFPVQMAHDLYACCPGNAQLHLVPGVGHCEPFYNPQMSFWGPVINFLVS